MALAHAHLLQQQSKVFSKECVDAFVYARAFTALRTCAKFLHTSECSSAVEPLS